MSARAAPVTAADDEGRDEVAALVARARAAQRIDR